MKYLLLLLLLASGSAMAHELTPTYPTLNPSHVPGVLSATVVLWNAREEIEWYKVEVFDKDMNPVRFIALGGELKKVDYLGRAHIEVFIREEDKVNATFICTQSKIKKGSEQRSLVASKVCSKLK